MPTSLEQKIFLFYSFILQMASNDSDIPPEFDLKNYKPKQLENIKQPTFTVCAELTAKLCEDLNNADMSHDLLDLLRQGVLDIASWLLVFDDNFDYFKSKNASKKTDVRIKLEEITREGGGLCKALIKASSIITKGPTKGFTGFRQDLKLRKIKKTMTKTNKKFDGWYQSIPVKSRRGELSESLPNRDCQPGEVHADSGLGEVERFSDRKAEAAGSEPIASSSNPQSPDPRPEQMTNRGGNATPASAVHRTESQDNQNPTSELASPTASEPGEQERSNDQVPQQTLIPARRPSTGTEDSVGVVDIEHGEHGDTMSSGFFNPELRLEKASGKSPTFSSSLTAMMRREGGLIRRETRIPFIIVSS
jgi:hypothetical protein